MVFHFQPSFLHRKARKGVLLAYIIYRTSYILSRSQGSSVPEMAPVREDERDAVFVRCCDDLSITL
jgi:hypothetical protein